MRVGKWMAHKTSTAVTAPEAPTASPPGRRVAVTREQPRRRAIADSQIEGEELARTVQVFHVGAEPPQEEHVEQDVHRRTDVVKERVTEQPPHLTVAAPRRR